MEIIRVENSYARRYNHIKGILMDYFQGCIKGNVAHYKEPEFLKSDHCTMVFFRLQYMEKMKNQRLTLREETYVE